MNESVIKCISYPDDGDDGVSYRIRWTKGTSKRFALYMGLGEITERETIIIGVMECSVAMAMIMILYMNRNGCTTSWGI